MREYVKKSQQDTALLRVDANENRKALVEAARELFKTVGPEVALSDIAKAAHVSRPTFYRNFPDRQAIIMAVFHSNIDVLEKYAAEEKDSPEKFFFLFRIILQQQLDFQSLMPYADKEDMSLNLRLMDIFRKPVEDAQAAGKLRKDFNLENDLNMLIMMLGGALIFIDKDNLQARAERAMEFLVKGIQ